MKDQSFEIIADDFFMEQMDFLVCVRCFTYNHVSYIEDAMNGFCMQQTHFPYVCVIVDDASTDGEQGLIKSYLALHFDLDNHRVVRNEETDDYVMTFAQHKTNKNCFFAFYSLKYNHFSIKKDKFSYFSNIYDGVKYHALCEGDDFWIRPNKLQLQVNFLDSHKDYSMIHTAFKFVDTNSMIIPTPQSDLYESFMNKKKEGYLWQYHLVEGTSIMFCTFIYRNGIMDNEKTYIDHGQFMCCARKGKIGYIPTETSAYRINPNGAMRSAQESVLHSINNDIFSQLYYFSMPVYKTCLFYYFNIPTRLKVSEAILRSLKLMPSITVDRKWFKLFSILLFRPFNTLLLPIAVIPVLYRALGKHCR